MTDWIIQEWESSADPDNEAGGLLCDLCHTAIAWVEEIGEGPHGEEIEYTVWVTYFSIIGDPPVEGEEPSNFCEDCFSWLIDVAPALVALTSAVEARA